MRSLFTFAHSSGTGYHHSAAPDRSRLGERSTGPRARRAGLRDRGKLIHAEPQDVVALLDFIDSEDGSEPTSSGHPKTDSAPTDEAKL
jgi:hypothetical protein